MSGGEFSAKSISVAVACGIGAMISGASIILYSIPVLMLPIIDEFHWNRTEVSSAVLPALLTAGVVTPLIGRAIDRWGARRLVMLGVVLFAFATMAVATANGSLIQFYGLYCLLGLTGTAASAVAFNKVISGWFQRHRGIVLALVGCGSAVGASVVPWITQYLLDDYGWRGAYVWLGVIVLVVGIPVFALLFRDPPRNPAVAETGAAVEAIAPVTAIGVSAIQARRTRTFWLVVGAIAINALVGFGLQIHVFALLTDRGVSDNDAVRLLFVYGIGGVCGQVAAGFMLDRIDSPKVALPFFASVLLGLLLLDYGSGFATLLSAGLLMRIGVGAELSMAPYLLARFFGLKSFAEIYGTLYFVATLVAGAGPIMMGFCYDHTHSYRPALAFFEILVAISIGFITLLGPYVFAVRPPKHGEAHGATPRRTEGGHPGVHRVAAGE